jgi:hypothetical protein
MSSFVAPFIRYAPTGIAGWRDGRIRGTFHVTHVCTAFPLKFPAVRKRMLTEALRTLTRTGNYREFYDLIIRCQLLDNEPLNCHPVALGQ